MPERPPPTSAKTGQFAAICGKLPAFRPQEGRRPMFAASPRKPLSARTDGAARRVPNPRIVVRNVAAGSASDPLAFGSLG